MFVNLCAVRFASSEGITFLPRVLSHWVVAGGRCSCQRCLPSCSPSPGGPTTDALNEGTRSLRLRRACGYCREKCFNTLLAPSVVASYFDGPSYSTTPVYLVPRRKKSVVFFPIHDSTGELQERRHGLCCRIRHHFSFVQTSVSTFKFRSTLFFCLLQPYSVHLILSFFLSLALIFLQHFSFSFVSNEEKRRIAASCAGQWIASIFHLSWGVSERASPLCKPNCSLVPIILEPPSPKWVADSLVASIHCEGKCTLLRDFVYFAFD